MYKKLNDVLKKRSIVENSSSQLKWYQMIRAIAFFCYLSFFISIGNQGITNKFVNVWQAKLHQSYSLSEVDEEPFKIAEVDEEPHKTKLY